MKPVLILIRIIIVGIFWSIFFLEGIRVIMLRNWYFDIFNSEHWNIAWNLWLSGWVIDEPKEWAFVLIILTFIPLWLTGWAALSLISWEKLAVKAAIFPWNLFKSFFIKPVKIIKNTSMKSVKKKKSYKEVRPRSLRGSIDTSSMPPSSSTPTLSESKILTPAVSQSTFSAPAPKPIPQSPSVAEKADISSATGTFDHSLFQFDDDDDFEFNIDAFDEKPAPKKEESTLPAKKETNDNRDNNRNNKDKNRNNNQKDNRDKNNKDKNRQTSANNDKRNNVPAESKAGGPVASANTQPKNQMPNSVLDAIRQKGYEVITGATIKNTLISFIAVSTNQINLCLIDKESGDWLADEERFNDEEPLWFSESSHRISPVRKIDIVRQALEEKLADTDFDFKINAYVIIQIGNIINAEDMFEIWDTMNISVTRIDRGSPKELKLFANVLEEADGTLDKADFEKLRKCIRSFT